MFRRVEVAEDLDERIATTGSAYLRPSWVNTTTVSFDGPTHRETLSGSTSTPGPGEPRASRLPRRVRGRVSNSRPCAELVLDERQR